MASHEPHEVHHALRVVSCRGEVAHPVAVRLFLVFAAVLEGHGLDPGHRAHCHRRAGCAAAATQQGARDDPRQGRRVELLRLLDHGVDVPCVGMGDLVGHHARQLALVFRQSDEAPEDVDVAPGGRKGIDRRAVDHVEGEVEGNPLLPH